MALFDWLKDFIGDKDKDRRGQPAPAPQPGAPQPPPVSPPRPSASTPPPVPPRAIPQPPAAQAPQPQKPRRQGGTLDLDVDQFAPMSDADVKRQLQGVGPIRNWDFARRDRIPSAAEPRTLLIDRAMVGHGFITPEELTEIHKIGEEMDKARPDFAVAASMAEAAVKRSKEEKERLKKRKKAEAEERKRRHAEAVALRRRTDIVFLGRGVSKQLSDRRADVEKLAAAGLPVLATPADVAQALGLTVGRLRWLAFHSEAATESHYVRFTVPKRSGGERHLSAPHENLAAAQEWVLRNVLDKVPTHEAAHGFVAGRSTVSNAAPHVGKAVVVNTDLTDFFPTITFPRMRGVFKQLGYSPAVATVLALLCTEASRRVVVYSGKRFYVAAGPRHLPQGACTSPALSNLAARRLDSRLSGIARKLGWQYTRYADDLSFSAGPEGNEKVGYLLARIRHIAQDEGFAVNEKKTRVLRRSTAQTVTGIVVNDRPGIRRQDVRRLRAILHRARHEGLAKQNRENHPHFESWVRGMVAYVSMVNPAHGKPLREALDALSA